MSPIRFVAVAYLVFGLGAAHAQQAGRGIPLARSEMVEVSIGQGDPAVTLRAPAPEMPKGTQEAGRQLAGSTVETPTQNTIAIPGARDGSLPLPSNGVRFTFAQVPGADDTILTIENGYQQAVTYRAILTVNGQRTPTDVCLVPPARTMFEHWAYQIECIELYELETHDWREGDPMPCR